MERKIVRLHEKIRQAVKTRKQYWIVARIILVEKTGGFDITPDPFCGDLEGGKRFIYDTIMSRIQNGFLNAGMTGLESGIPEFRILVLGLDGKRHFALDKALELQAQKTFYRIETKAKKS